MEYFDHLKSRVTLPIMQALCRQHRLPTATSWEELRAKLVTASRVSDKAAQEVASKLERMFVESLTIGHRAVKLYRVKAAHIKAVFEGFAAIRRQRSEYASTYPRPLGKAALAALDDELKVCDVQADKDVVMVTLCGRRMVEKRVTRRRDEIGDAAIARFGWAEYDEFVLISRTYAQCYEVLRIDRRSRTVELRTEEHTGVDTGVVLEMLKVKANEIITRAGLDSRAHLQTSVNLFPAIKSLYDDATEGTVIELGFTTTTGSSKLEKMRNGRGDLRGEKFHVGGKTAVSGRLSSFRIGVRWARDEAGAGRLHEEVVLPGSIRLLSSGSPFLDHMDVSGASSEERMQALIDRVEAHLPAEQ